MAWHFAALREQFARNALDSGSSKEARRMAEDKSKDYGTGRADLERINVDQEQELRHWSATLGVTHWEVKAAVRKVGPLAKDVARALGSNARV
jgi:Protein of unknown function (DUF3606)